MRAFGSGITHVGRVRAVNEDSMTLDDALGCWVVADGMGGHSHGQWASQTVVDAFKELSNIADFDELVSNAASAIHNANSLIFQ
jgi:serine/threonine protein phosphatase PrpC